MQPPSSLALATPRGGRPPTDRRSRIRGGKLDFIARSAVEQVECEALTSGADRAARGPGPGSEHDRAVLLRRQALAQLLTQALARRGVQRHRVRRRRPLAAEEGLPVVGKVGEVHRDLDRLDVDIAQAGVAPGGGQRIGLADRETLGMILTGRRVPAAEGQTLGFVNEVVPQAKLMETAKRWAREICECSPLSIRASKDVVYRGLDIADLNDAMTRSYDSVRALVASEDFIEGPKAFAEKRAPNWKGR